MRGKRIVFDRLCRMQKKRDEIEEKIREDASKLSRIREKTKSLNKTEKNNSI